MRTPWCAAPCTPTPTASGSSSPQYFDLLPAIPQCAPKSAPGRDGRTLLEACVENATRTPAARLARCSTRARACDARRSRRPLSSACRCSLPEPSSGQRGAPDARGAGVPPSSGRAMHVLAPSGGSAHFLFELRPEDSGDNTAATTSGAGDAGEPLGKLEIRWRGPMGEAGRLQTQQIMATPRPQRDVEITIAPSLPTTATLARPLSLQCVVRNARRQRRCLWNSSFATGGGSRCGRPRGDDREGRRAAARESRWTVRGGCRWGFWSRGEATAEVTVVPLAPGDAAVAQGGGARRGGEVG